MCWLNCVLQEIVECESLWHLSADGDQESDLAKGPVNGANANNPDYLQELCAAADRRLYRLVKWCKSLPLFKNIQVTTGVVFVTTCSSCSLENHCLFLLLNSGG
jgi:hypothetical protein